MHGRLLVLRWPLPIFGALVTSLARLCEARFNTTNIIELKYSTPIAVYTHTALNVYNIFILTTKDVENR